MNTIIRTKKTVFLTPDLSELVSISTDSNGIETKQSFCLKKVNKNTLMKKRLSRIPGFVAKVDGQLYYTEIPSNFSLPDDFMNGKHCCSLGSRVCKFLKPLPIQEGGCDKVLDSCVTFQSRMGYKFETAVLKSQRIEKYDWIIEGYETFNIPCNENIFQITCCSRVQY